MFEHQTYKDAPFVDGDTRRPCSSDPNRVDDSLNALRIVDNADMARPDQRSPARHDARPLTRRRKPPTRLVETVAMPQTGASHPRAPRIEGRVVECAALPHGCAETPCADGSHAAAGDNPAIDWSQEALAFRVAQVGYGALARRAHVLRSGEAATIIGGCGRRGESGMQTAARCSPSVAVTAAGRLAGCRHRDANVTGDMSGACPYRLNAVRRCPDIAGQIDLCHPVCMYSKTPRSDAGHVSPIDLGKCHLSCGCRNRSDTERYLGRPHPAGHTAAPDRARARAWHQPPASVSKRVLRSVSWPSPQLPTCSSAHGTAAEPHWIRRPARSSN